MTHIVDDLNQLAKYRLSLILQGSSSFTGTHIKWLKFPSDPNDREKEIQGFIDLINRKFRGILQIIADDDYISPIIKNTKAENYPYRILGKDAVALSLIILLHSFHNEFGPSIQVLEEKLAGTKLDKKSIKLLLSDLSKFRLINIKIVNGIEIFEPTNVLQGCLSHSFLAEVISKVYNKTKDEILKKFMPPSSFLKIQQQVGNKIMKITDFFIKINDENISGDDLNG